MNAVEAGSGPLLTLAPLSVLAGIVAAHIFRRFSHPRALRRTTNRMLALAMEFRLFLDEPALVLSAQRRLFLENARLVKLIALPTLIVTAASVLLYPQLDGLYGYAPLPVNEPAVITARFKPMPATAPSLLSDSQALLVETPGLRALATGEVSWRIRPVAAMSGDVLVQAPANIQSKRVVAGRRALYLTPVRGSSWLTSIAHPFETPLSGGIETIEVAYPPQTILGFAWTIWFFGLMSLSALVAARR